MGASIRSPVAVASVLFTLLLGGGLSTAAVLEFVGLETEGVDGVTGLFGARSVAVSPDGKHVYVASANGDALAAFSRHPKTGVLSFIEAEFDEIDGVDGLNGPLGTHAVALSPDGANVYVAGSLDSAVAVFSRDPDTGELDFIEVQRDSVNGVDGLAGSWGVTVSPDGAHVYAAGFLDQAIAVFERDGTGALTFVETQKKGLGGVTNLDDP